MFNIDHQLVGENKLEHFYTRTAAKQHLCTTTPEVVLGTLSKGKGLH